MKSESDHIWDISSEDISGEAVRLHMESDKPRSCDPTQSMWYGQSVGKGPCPSMVGLLYKNYFVSLI